MDKQNVFSRISNSKDKLVQFVKSTKEIDAYSLAKAISTPPLKGLFRTVVNGLENIPPTGGVIIASNHRSFIDSIFIPYAIKRRVTFVAKAEYFDSRKTRWFFSAMGQIPIRRDSADSALGALASAKEILDQGKVFAIYPEGSRTRDGFLHRGHTGVARLALETKAVLIPVGIRGTENVQSPDELMPRIGKTVEINIGRPINTAKYEGKTDTRLALRNLTDELMYEIFLLCRYGYVDTYVKSMML